MSLNVNGNHSDPNYRYKMPRLKTTQSGSGKNSHTYLTNLKSISESLGHVDSILLKFIGFKIGTNIDSGKYSIKGHYSSEDLQKEIYEYINRFVICPNCGIPELIPELEIISKKKKRLKLKCSACGNISETKNDKHSTKVADNIIKLLEKNQWIIKKGSIVNESKDESSNDNDLFEF